MVSSNYSFQLRNDTLTAVSLSTAGITAIAILVTLVTLTHFQYLPSFTYYIAGGGAATALLIGFLVATCRRNNAQTSHSEQQQANVPNQQSGVPIASTQGDALNITTVAPPPILDVLARATYVTISPNANRCSPPSKVCPFITANFSFTLVVGNEKFNYDLPIIEFSQIQNNVSAYFVHNDKIYNIVVNEESGREYSKDGLSWTLPVEKQSPRADQLNEKIQLEGYLSSYEAWYRLGHLLNENKGGWYFVTKSTKKNVTFEVAGLQSESVRHEGSVVLFTRDLSRPLIHPDQIALLKKSSNEWESNVGHQLDNPLWHYDVGRPILSVASEGNRIFIEFEEKRQ